MATPTRATALGMSLSKDGRPWVRVASKSTQVANSLAFSRIGTPFWFLVSAVTGTNIQIDIGSTWKTVTDVSINIGGSWKTVTGIQQNISSSWKTIF